jgi:OOP family OmpA-OmpF porin
VDEQGCPYPGVVLRGVNFETNSDVLTAQSLPVLYKVASGLAQHPHMKVELQGYTDSTGSAAYNLGLSQRRADAVREYLMRRGVAGDQLLAKGYGEGPATRPRPGRLSNRRVVMHVLENPRDIPVKDEGKAQE